MNDLLWEQILIKILRHRRKGFKAKIHIVEDDFELFLKKIIGQLPYTACHLYCQ